MLSTNLAILWVTAVTAVSLAYYIAGSIWIERHSLWFKFGGRRTRVSGAYGEVALVTGGVAMLIGIDLASPQSDFDALFETWPIPLAAAFVFILPFIWIHGVRSGLAGRPGEKRRLVATYFVYGVFSTVFFFGGVCMMALLARQYAFDYEIVQTLRETALAPLYQPINGADDVQRALEFSYIDAQALLARVEDSMSPTFVFAAGLFAINLALRLTPLRGLYLKNAVLMTHLMTILAILVILVSGAWAYIGNYSAFIDAYLQKLQEIRGAVSEFGMEHFGRYADIVATMTNQKTLLGFVTRLSNEWAGLAAVLGLTQWAAQQFVKPEAVASPADAGAVEGAAL